MKKLKHLFTILLTIFCITNVSYAASLDYGLYNVKNDVYHEQELGMNMARTYLNQTMRVDAKTNGTYYYTVEFSGTEYMNKHRILVNGSQVSTTKKSNSSNGTIKLTFKVKSLSSKIKARIYVDAMGRDVEFQIIPDFSTAKCVQKYSKKETTKTDKTDKTNKSDKKENTKSDSKKEESKKESTKSDSDKTKETEKVDAPAIPTPKIEMEQPKTEPQVTKPVLPEKDEKKPVPPKKPFPFKKVIAAVLVVAAISWISISVSNRNKQREQIMKQPFKSCQMATTPLPNRTSLNFPVIGMLRRCPSTANTPICTKIERTTQADRMSFQTSRCNMTRAGSRRLTRWKPALRAIKQRKTPPRKLSVNASLRRMLQSGNKA